MDLAASESTDLVDATAVTPRAPASPPRQNLTVVLLPLALVVFGVVVLALALWTLAASAVPGPPPA